MNTLLGSGEYAEFIVYRGNDTLLALNEEQAMQYVKEALDDGYPYWDISVFQRKDVSIKVIGGVAQLAEAPGS